MKMKELHWDAAKWQNKVKQCKCSFSEKKNVLKSNKEEETCEIYVWLNGAVVWDYKRGTVI